MGNNSQQFLGYWGYGSQRELEVVLSKVTSRYLSQDLRSGDKKIALTNHRDALDAEGERVECISSDENSLHPIWNVAYIGLKSRLSITLQPNRIMQIAALSASGCVNSPDAWVSMRLNDCLILGREPFGRMPLYWAKLGQVIWFASQMQLLLPLVEPEVSIPGLYGYSCFSYVPTPLTPVVNVFAVPAGTEVTLRCDRHSGMLSTPKSQRLSEWREDPEQLLDEATAVAQLQTLLQHALVRQIADLTNEPVGVFLSGGLDSSIVAALLVQAGVKVRAYTLDFGSAGIPEYPYAEQVAQFLNIPLVKVEATPRYIQLALIPTVQALDLPFGDGVTVPLYLLNQAASQETQVIFNGEGGDQLFAGWTNKPLITVGVYQHEHPMPENFQKQYLRTFHRLWGCEAQVYQPEVYAQIQNLHPEDWISVALDPAFNTSILHRLRRASLMLKGAQNIHPRATNLGRATGLLVRSPFCDQHLAEWTFRLSGELCLQGVCEKYILKRAVEGWLPSEIVWRQKRGMGVPLTSWCLNDFWHQVGIWLNPGILGAENRFSPYLAAQIVEGKLGGTIFGRRIGEILWLLIMWQLWRSHVLGEEVGKHSWDHPFWLPPWLWRNYKPWQR